MIVFGRVIGSIYNSDGFFVFNFRVSGGDFYVATYEGDDPPPVRKTVQIQVVGEWVKHKAYGKQIRIDKWKRSEVKQIDYNRKRDWVEL